MEFVASFGRFRICQGLEEHHLLVEDSFRKALLCCSSLLRFLVLKEEEDPNSRRLLILEFRHKSLPLQLSLTLYTQQLNVYKHWTHNKTLCSINKQRLRTVLDNLSFITFRSTFPQLKRYSTIMHKQSNIIILPPFITKLSQFWLMICYTLRINLIKT